MRRFIVMMIVAMLVATGAQGQTYTALWKQVTEAEQKDLPKTQIAILQKIGTKARKEKAYGQLLAAELRRASVQTQISPDSLAVEIARLEKAGEQENDLVLQAIYQSVLGRIYKNCYTIENYEERSKACYEKSLRHPELLASQKATAYQPLIVSGVDSKVFGNDLLSMLAMEADNWQLLRDYYAKQGNRKVTAFLQLRDSAEAAIRRVNEMNNDKTVPAVEKIRYIDEALAKWGSYQRMNELRNIRIQLTTPMFSVSAGRKVSLPNQARTFEVTALRNIRSLTLTLSRVHVDASTTLNPNDDNDYAKLKKLITPQHQIQQTKHYRGLAEYEVVKDSFLVEPLPVGTYLVEFTTDNKKVKSERELMFVTDLYVLQEALPDKQIRYAVVNATTGQPVSGATLVITLGGRYGDKMTEKQLKTDEQGEVIYTYGSQEPSAVRAYTDSDQYLPDVSAWGRFSYYENKSERDVANLYTDRKLYRPGQTVHVAMLLFHNCKGIETKALKERPVTLTLRDANYKTVATKEVTTDAYGQANADFELPNTGLTGQFSIRTDVGGGATYFNVEEYKRPTFEVTFEKTEQSYQAGDTITVKGTAKTYASVPVQGAKVSYQVVRRQAYWWWRSQMEPDTVLVNDTIVTADDGTFEVRVPFIIDNPQISNLKSQISNLKSRFYTFEVSATVTDVGGESHEGHTSLPLGTKPTAFTCELPEKSERDKLKAMKFVYVNNAGTEIEGTVRYRFDDGTEQIAKANEVINMANQSFTSGRHTLTAVCGTDTLRQEIMIFSIEDKQPVVETHDWFYQTETEFPRDGKPVYVQIGSSDADQHILYTIIAGSQLLESGTIDQSNALHTRAFTYQEEYGTGIRITYAWVKDGVMYTHSTTIALPLPDKRLTLTWKTFRDRLTPGQKEEWRLNITRSDGSSANAQLMVTLYDKSLDQIRRHSWDFSLLLSRNLPSALWKGGSRARFGLSGMFPSDYLQDVGLDFSHFDDGLFGFASPYLFTRGIRVRGTRNVKMAKTTAIGAFNVESVDLAAAPMMASANAKEEKVFDAVEQMPSFPETQEPTTVQIRENLTETAFFYPALESDGNGNVSIKFTLPESITTWKLIGLAHDTEMNYGIIEGEAVAKKIVMIQPNMPRFLRIGDHATLSAKLFNTSERVVKGTAMIQLIDPETEKIVYQQERKYEVKAEGTGSVTFEIQPSTFNLQPSTLYICKVMASGKGYSDGEQHYLPILPDQELVTNTYPFTQHEPGTLTVDLTKLFPQSTAQHPISDTRHLTIEYTNNPTWLMIQALPSISNPWEDNAMSLAAAYYANSLGRNLLNQSPAIKDVILQWRQEEGKETPIMSSLEKNEELKSIVLDETPWVADARREAEQKRQLVNFFDEATMSYRLNNTIQKLGKLQNTDGSWSWWQGMSGSLYMTTAVSEMLVRLNTMLGKQKETSTMLTNALKFMSQKTHEEVEELKKQEKKGVKDLRPSEIAINYLYLRALDGRTLSASEKADNDYLVKLLATQTSAFTIYGKAVSAIILAKNGYQKKAKEYLQSIREYTVYTEEMGRYFDTRKAYYSWRDYKIPTEVAAIEAIGLLEPEDQQTVEEMRRWLLQEKRTQSWDTPMNSVNAIYAFLQGNISSLSTLGSQLSTLRVDGKVLDIPQATEGMGYVKVTKSVKNPQTFTATKTSEGTSWGAVYAQFMQPVTDISDASSGLTVTREVVQDKPLQVGDKVKVRITIQAERDYDFVQVVDKRAACLEPVRQLSGYRWGYYCAPRDNATYYYFDQMAKGKHVVETEYYIDREGEYQTGTCTVQCAYSPEYMARIGGKSLKIKN